MRAVTARKTSSRAMTSPVNWSLLGLVIDRSSYGWELANRFQRVYGEVLPVSGDSHAYSALDALQARGMIEIAPGTGIGRQPKPHYRATPFGLRSYEDWLVAQVDAEGRRQELWVRQLAIFVNNPETALRVIDRYERQYLKAVGQARRSPEDSAADPRSRLIDDLVAKQHHATVAGMLSWLQYARDRFEALAKERAHYEPPRA